MYASNILKMNDTSHLKIELVQVVDNFVYAPNQALVDHISSYLSDVYLFGTYDSYLDYDLKTETIQDLDLREQLEEILLEMFASNGDPDIAKALYSICGNKEVSGTLHGIKRAIITDALRLSYACATKLSTTGLIADVGCNSGYLLNWLCGLTQRPGMGIDTAFEPIELANTLSSHENVRFIVSSWDVMNFPEKPSLIICSDTVKLSSDFLDWVRQQLSDDGYLLHIHSVSPDFDLIKGKELGCQHFELIGGYEVGEFNSRYASIISRNPSANLSAAESMWNSSLQEWFNADVFPNGKKSFSQYLTQFV